MPNNKRWPLERVLFALAGTVTLLSALLAATVSIWFLVLTAFVGVNQWLYVLVGNCPASIVLRRACHLRSAIYQQPKHAAGAARRSRSDGDHGTRAPARRTASRRSIRTRSMSARSAGSAGSPQRISGRSSLGWVVRRARARVLRPARRDRALRRRLGDDRLAIGAGPPADQPELPRTVQLRADDRRLLAVEDGQRPGVPGRDRQRRAHAQGRPRRQERGRARTRASRSRRDGHTAIVQAGAAKSSNGMVKAAEQHQGQARRALGRRRAGASHRRLGHVV